MVTLKVTDRFEEHTVVLSEYEWSLIKQAKYYNEKKNDLIGKVVMRNKNFDKNNKNWVDAHSAVSNYVCYDSPAQVKCEVAYD